MPLFTLHRQIKLRSYASCSKTHLQVYNSPLLIKRSNFHEPSGHSQDEKWEGAKVKARRLQSRNTWDKISRTDCTQRQMMACSSYLIVFAVRLFHSTFSFYIPVFHISKGMFRYSYSTSKVSRGRDQNCRHEKQLKQDTFDVPLLYECSHVFCIWVDESKPEMLNLHFAQC